MTTLIAIIGGTQYIFPKQKPAAKIVELSNSKTNSVTQNKQKKLAPQPNQNNTAAVVKQNDKETPFPIPKTKLSLICLLYTSPSPRDGLLSRMPSSA